ncbi:MAG: Uma2 family endonuclease [Myxococcales bacterium]|nr:Uma2 family endonuclease [Myxococcales bacterium]
MAAALNLRDSLYAELEALPDNVTGEIVAGELVVSPRPGLDHSRAASTGLAQLLPAFVWQKAGGGGGPRRWFLTVEPELHLGDDVLVPDLAGWYADRLGDTRGRTVLTLAPDWVCEILSPSTARRDRGSKADRYAMHGVRWLWLVDPAEELIEAWELVNQRWTRLGVWSGDDVAAIAPFETLPLELCRWWGREPGERDTRDAGNTAVGGDGADDHAMVKPKGDSDEQGVGTPGD